MIGVICKPEQLQAVEELFQLFKIPWEFHRPGAHYAVVIATTVEVSKINTKLLLLYGPDTKNVDSELGVIPGGHLQSPHLSYREWSLPIYDEACTFAEACNSSAVVMAGGETVGIRITQPDSTVIRLGYDLFREVEYLLSNAQPLESAAIPTLDAHISMLRGWILEEGIPLIEIPPVPAGHSFTVCLTHDIDFIGIRGHKFDHTMWGFLYRSSVGAIRNRLRGRISTGRLFEIWRAVMSLPLVYLGWARDFWEPFEWYLKAEQNLPATYFLIPFKRRAGEHVPGRHASRRATAYDVGDLKHWAARLTEEGCELGVHGLDAWNSVEKGRAELARVSSVTGQPSTGIRMHWLLQDAKTVEVLEESGFSYDSTAGYNETIGYRNGTMQVFRPLGARTLLEVPLHIQDGALFYAQRLNLSEQQAAENCQVLIDNVARLGGVLTLLWHDRSHGPERFWGGFYLTLLQKLKSLNPWFGTAGQVVSWFGERRAIKFQRFETAAGVQTQIQYSGGGVEPPFRVRVYRPAQAHQDGATFVDVPWSGKSLDDLANKIPSPFSATVADPVLS